MCARAWARSAGLKGGFTSKAPLCGRKPKKLPREPKGASQSGKALQKWPNQQFRGEAKHSAQTPKRSASTRNAAGGKASWNPPPPRDWYRSIIASAACSNGGPAALEWRRCSARSLASVAGGAQACAPTAGHLSSICPSLFLVVTTGSESPRGTGLFIFFAAKCEAFARLCAMRSASCLANPTCTRSPTSVGSALRASTGSKGSKSDAV
mmetsp:Transcript_25418/g.72831  ORF Transcript_25418/g.72831 Transcript_25418/m.72831 type:complete len:209 (+) Transcript_25418:504-1130(+)